MFIKLQFKRSDQFKAVDSVNKTDINENTLFLFASIVDANPVQRQYHSQSQRFYLLLE